MVMPHIFSLTCVSLAFILFSCTLVGRQFAIFLPYRIRPFVKFYLSPVFGLAVFILLAAFVGRSKPIGESILTPLSFFTVIVLALGWERHFSRTLKHSALVFVFGMICAIPFLAQLYSYGGYNAHNDAFTYLSHAEWLQHNAFNSSIPPTQITAVSSQVALYQSAGLRMGGSYLLSFFEALLNYKWAFSIYPSVILTALICCCLSIGLVLSLIVKRINRFLSLTLLTLPALSLGGLTFGSLNGFLPQTIGLATGAATLFLYGALLPYIEKKTSILPRSKVSTLLNALLLSACAISYTEMMPFVLLTMAASTLVIMLKTKRFSPYFIYGLLCILFSLWFVKSELSRMLLSFHNTMHAQVGTPVDWPLAGFIAHQFGIHGGAWDILQWTKGQANHPLVLSLILAIGLIAVFFLLRRKGFRFLKKPVLLPTLIVLALYSASILYFRYFVSNPFPIGVGHNWNQFKLADWSSPFAAVLVVIGMGFCLKKWALRAGLILSLGLISVLAFCNIYWTTERLGGITHYYQGVTNLESFYINTRNQIIQNCGPASSIHLFLDDKDYKFKEILALILSDRTVFSSWSNDNSIAALLTQAKSKKPGPGDCVVQREFLKKDGGNGETFLKIGMFKNNESASLVSVKGGYNLERDENHFWYWVKQKIQFQFAEAKDSVDFSRTKLEFQYRYLSPHELTLQIVDKNNQTNTIVLPQIDLDTRKPFETTLNLRPADIKKIIITSDGHASALSPKDKRLARFSIYDIRLKPVA